MSESDDEVVRAAADAFMRRQRMKRTTRTRAYLQLMRLPNVFTAMADVAMGFLFVQSAGPWHFTRLDYAALAALVAASSLLYLAGMVLNDVFDVEVDRQERPERPLPSGKIPFETAQRLGWLLLALGVAVASASMFLIGHFLPGMVAALLAIAIVLYDAWLKRTPVGPLAMGACRTLNILLGMSAFDLRLRPEHWLVAGGIGVYIAGVTWFARKESQQSRQLPLILATAVMLLGIGLVALFPRFSDHVIPAVKESPALKWYGLMGVLGFLVLRRSFLAIGDPTPLKVQRVVAECLLLLIVIDGLVTYAASGVLNGALVMLLLLPAFLPQLLADWIRTT
jgi:4-hydroxybenzoate polyprenyltransferase